MSRDARRLPVQIKNRLIRRGLERRLAQIESGDHVRREDAASEAIPESHYRFELQPGYEQVQLIEEGAHRFGVESPFFYVHEGKAGATTQIAGRRVINFASYNYLALSGDPRVSGAAKEATERYGTSVSASRIVAGERPIHGLLEKGIAEFCGVEDALVMVSGHATNVTTIGHLLGPKDLVIHDEYAHNSVTQGVRLSGAQRFAFPHNNMARLAEILERHRRQAERVLIVVEGLYSMDGDLPDLPRLVELKTAYKAWLMVDEAHSLGVVGANGKGVAEHFSIDPRDVDIWMGTLSKSLASCGGYVAGSRALVKNLRYMAPGFLYSVGMPAPVAAAALAALDVLRAEPERVQTLQVRGRMFCDQLGEAGLDTGLSAGFAIVPVLVGNSLRAVRLASRLLENGIHVQPILYPAVPEGQARLRFFLSCAHSAEDLQKTILILKEAFA